MNLTSHLALPIPSCVIAKRLGSCLTLAAMTSPPVALVLPVPQAPVMMAWGLDEDWNVLHTRMLCWKVGWNERNPCTREREWGMEGGIIAVCLHIVWQFSTWWLFNEAQAWQHHSRCDECTHPQCNHDMVNFHWKRSRRGEGAEIYVLKILQLFTFNLAEINPCFRE